MASEWAKVMAPYAARAIKYGLDRYVPYPKGNGRRPGQNKKSRRKARGRQPRNRRLTQTSLIPVAVPAAQSYRSGPNKMQMSRGKTQRGGPRMLNPTTVKISAQQYIIRIALANGFRQYKWGMNPSDPQAFGWLSNLAPMYDKYRVKNFGIRYVPACASSLTGEVLIYYNPDASETLQLTADNYMALKDSPFVRAGPVWSNLQFDVCTQDLQIYKWLRTRGGGEIITGNTQPNDLYDFGQLIVVTNGSSAVANLGSIYINYEIEFRDRQSTIISSGHWWDSLFGGMATGALASAVVPLPEDMYNWRSPFRRYNSQYMEATIGGSCMMDIMGVGTAVTGITALMVSGGAGDDPTCTQILGSHTSGGTNVINKYHLTFSKGDLLQIKATCDDLSALTLHGSRVGTQCIFDPDVNHGGPYDWWGAEI